MRHCDSSTGIDGGSSVSEASCCRVRRTYSGVVSVEQHCYTFPWCPVKPRQTLPFFVI